MARRSDNYGPNLGGRVNLYIALQRVEEARRCTTACGRRRSDRQRWGLIVGSGAPFTRERPMSTESHLREKLRKIEALFTGAGNRAGELR
jgi:hypothetical protein